MKVLLVLCMAAVVLTGEIFAYTYRGQTEGDMMQLPYKPDKPGFCKPGSCVVQSGLICECKLTGVIICPVRNIPNSYCRCQPGEILPTRRPCLCPKSGKMPLMGCEKVFPPAFPVNEGQQGDKRQSDDESFGLSRDAALRCDHYECYPSPNGQKCIWVPCPQGP